MDEVIFRSSQKLDNLQVIFINTQIILRWIQLYVFQVQLNLAASEGKNILQQYSEQTKAVIHQALQSPKYSQLKENLQDFWFFCATLIGELKENAERFPKTVYDSFIKTLGKQCNRAFFCCSAYKQLKFGRFRDQTECMLWMHWFYSWWYCWCGNWDGFT